ncbi:MAG: NADH-quinone oxidoreductase subunit N [Deltaproteobacteria bacterium]|nr:MAG: NADH-quinone oxidoreductase subunit N [Deltaproteobacteria bacterium]
MSITLPSINLIAVAPLIVLVIFAFLALLSDLFVLRGKTALGGHLSLLGVIAASLFSFILWGIEDLTFQRMIILDRFSIFFNLLFLLSAALTILISYNYLKDQEMDYGEYYVLLLIATLGMMIMSAGTDLITIFLGLELMSISFYILAGFRRTRARSLEAALKYFLLGAFATGFLLYGIALIYGASGTTNLQGIVEFLKAQESPVNPVMLIGCGLLIVGFGFKVAVIPFHQWTPDVYEGAPTPITAFMSVGVKAAGFAALLRVLLIALGDLEPNWSGILWVIAVITMIVGNIVAIAQDNIKRMLAYSSIAQTAYVLVGFISGGELGMISVVFYLAIYTLMNIGAFSVVTMLEKKGEENLLIPGYVGVGFKHPLLGLAMAVFMFSLAGIPPTAGFIGKFYIFSAAVKSDYIGLAVIGVLCSVISAYYYLRVLVVMYMREPEGEVTPRNRSAAASLSITITAIGVLVLGIIPSSILELVRQAVRALI